MTITYPARTVREFTAYSNLLKQPHVLIAGTTGAGKSVLMNGLIYTALNANPGRVQLALIDTKMTELRLYKKLPHTIPNGYAETPATAAELITQVLQITRDRAKRSADRGERLSSEAALYLFIDELGDLAFADKSIIKTLSNIAMIGRAANVHIIAATQNPNRKTLSAELASNCPARVALRCRDAIESRQVIGTADAVTLPKYGEALALLPENIGIVKFKVEKIPDEVLTTRVNWWIAERKRLIKEQHPLIAWLY